jgi:hypothetical protein
MRPFEPSQPGPAYVDDGSALGPSDSRIHDQMIANARASLPLGPFASSCPIGSSTIGQKTTAPRVPLPSTARLAHVRQRDASVGAVRKPRPSPTDVIVYPTPPTEAIQEATAALGDELAGALAGLDTSQLAQLCEACTEPADEGSKVLNESIADGTHATAKPLNLEAPGSGGSISAATPPTTQSVRITPPPETPPPEPPPRRSSAKSPVGTPPEPPPRRRSTSPRRTSQATSSITTRLSQTTMATTTAIFTATPIATMGDAETAAADSSSSPASSPGDLPIEFYPSRASSSALSAVSEVGDCDARRSIRIRASNAFSRQRQQAAELAAGTGRVSPTTSSSRASSDASPSSDPPSPSPPLPPPRARAYIIEPPGSPSGSTVRPSEASAAATFEMELTLPGPNGDVKIRVLPPSSPSPKPKPNP